MATTKTKPKRLPNSLLRGPQADLIKQNGDTSNADPSVNMGEPKGTLSVKRLKRILEYIQDNLSEDLSLTDLASLADLSPYHFARLFKQSTGLPPHRYILNQRIERAKLFLEDPHYSSLADISYQLGFSSQSHFTRAFRNFTGTTPAYYRKYSA